jgi:serine/threonine protein kinase
MRRNGSWPSPRWRDGEPAIEKDLVRASLAQRLFGGSVLPTLLGGYEVIQRIGAGGTGFVFEARDPRTGQHLALKILRSRDPVGLQRLKREFRSFSALHHPNLVQLFELSLEGAEPYLAMELVRGGSLFDYVRGDGELDERRARNCLRQLVDAVSTLPCGRHSASRPQAIESDGRARRAPGATRLRARLPHRRLGWPFRQKRRHSALHGSGAFARRTCDCGQ